METPARFREAGEKSLKHAGRWDCGTYWPDICVTISRVAPRASAVRLHHRSASPLFAPGADDSATALKKNPRIDLTRGEF
jgi:hypothetical protein